MKYSLEARMKKDKYLLALGIGMMIGQIAFSLLLTGCNSTMDWKPASGAQKEKVASITSTDTVNAPAGLDTSQGSFWRPYACAAFAPMIKSGQSYGLRNGYRYSCQDASLTRTVRILLFDDLTVIRQESGFSEEVFTMSSDANPCYMNFSDAGHVIRYDFTQQAIDGSNYMLTFKEWLISNGSYTNWTCSYETDGTFI